MPSNEEKQGNDLIATSIHYRHLGCESRRLEWHVKGSVTCGLRTLEKNENTSDQTFNLELGLKGVLVI